MDVHLLLLCHVWNIDLHFLTEKWPLFVLQTAHPLAVVFVVIHQHNSLALQDWVDYLKLKCFSSHRSKSRKEICDQIAPLSVRRHFQASEVCPKHE